MAQKRDKPLTMRQLDIIHDYCHGSTKNELVERYGVSMNQVNTLVRSDRAKETMLAMAERMIVEAAPKAAKVLMRQMDSSNEWVAQNAAGRVLNLASTLQQAKDNQIVVNFNGIMPKPGMPSRHFTLDETNPVTGEGSVK